MLNFQLQQICYSKYIVMIWKKWDIETWIQVLLSYTQKNLEFLEFPESIGPSEVSYGSLLKSSAFFLIENDLKTF